MVISHFRYQSSIPVLDRIFNKSILAAKVYIRAALYGQLLPYMYVKPRCVKPQKIDRLRRIFIFSGGAATDVRAAIRKDENLRRGIFVGMCILDAICGAVSLICL